MKNSCDSGVLPRVFFATFAPLRDIGFSRVIELPMPSLLHFDGVRLPASYANFYIANDMVLVPTFNDANDRG